MSKNKIIIVLLIMLSIGIVSLYTTFGYEEVNTVKEQSNSDYKLIYSLKEEFNKEIVLNANEEKFIDITLKNTYENTIKYGMYYYLINPTSLPDNVEITLAEGSENSLEDVIKPQETKTVSIRITNNSEYTINLIVGALIGYERGNVEELITDGEVLIK
ncbi:MAG: hypothetical protein IJE89_00605 [Bacilli bacterium]|nr:hypothetical protein [Bacilli bacterium]